MIRTHNCPRRRRGFSLIDILVGVFVLGLGAAAMFGLITSISKAQRAAQQESVANQLAHRMAEQLQVLRPTELTGETLTQLNLIDAGQTSQPYSFKHIPMDQGSRYSPATALRNGDAWLEIEDLDHNAKRVLITVQWQTTGGRTRQIHTGTIVGGFR